MIPSLRFTGDQAVLAATAWGANCGPGALAAATSRTLDEVRTALVGFDEKRYTNPTMMRGALQALRIPFRVVPDWPTLGLCRVQWHGPWTQPNVPIKARYRHTHWIAAGRMGGAVFIFDINAIFSGGWLPLDRWQHDLVPWLLREVEPKADGQWSITHRWEFTS